MPDLSEKELQELYIKIRRGDSQAREKVVRCNLPLVHAICKRFTPLEILDYDDLFQEGCIGLLKALTRYDPDRGVKFSTYAVPFILGEIKACLRRNGHLLKVSRSYIEHYSHLLRIQEELAKKLKRQPRLDEITEKMDMPAEEIIWLISLNNPPISLQEKTEGELSSELESEENLLNTESFFDSLIVRERINSLPFRERQIIVLRYIMDKSQEETAEILGLSQSHISRLEREAIKKLKANPL